MAHFHWLRYGNYVLKHIIEILGLQKLDFRGLNGKFYVKKAHFVGLLAKIGYSRLIFTARTHLWPIFMVYGMGNVH